MSCSFGGGGSCVITLLWRMGLVSNCWLQWSLMLKCGELATDVSCRARGNFFRSSQLPRSRRSPDERLFFLCLMARYFDILVWAFDQDVCLGLFVSSCTHITPQFLPWIRPSLLPFTQLLHHCSPGSEQLYATVAMPFATRSFNGVLRPALQKGNRNPQISEGPLTSDSQQIHCLCPSHRVSTSPPWISADNWMI